MLKKQATEFSVGEAYHLANRYYDLANKYYDLADEHQRLLEQYGQQQAIIEAYQRNYKKHESIQNQTATVPLAKHRRFKLL